MKFISCNIEGNKHFARLAPFFAANQPDVVCLQEVFERDLPELCAMTALPNFIFAPQAIVSQENIHLPARGAWGVAILAREFVSQQTDYYVGDAQIIPEFFANKDPNSMNRVLLSAKVRIDGDLFTLATTHFTWSGMGAVSDEQKRVYVRFCSLLEQFDELILCGDLNTPRGGEIFDDLAKKYRDNIPAEIETSIDRNLHKSGNDIRLMVDALFTSPQYMASQVAVVPNTSDHMAVVGEVEIAIE